MKVLHTADWHLGSPKSPYENGVNIRSRDTLNCIKEMLRVAKEEKPDYTLVSGDIFDKAEVGQGRGHKEVLQARSIILELSKVSKQVVVIRGTPNHDPIEAFEELKAHFESITNVHIITTPQVLMFDDVDIAALPGFDRGVFRTKFPGLSSEEENEVFTQELSNIILGLKAQCSPEKKSIFMTHYTVPGCNTESGQVMLLTQFEPIIPQEILLSANYDLVALGHIHRPQKLHNVENCYYSGAINAMNFNDENQERGFWIHNDLPFGDWDSVFYKTPIREFFTIHLSNEDIENILNGSMEFVAMQKWMADIGEKIVRVHYSCDYDNAKAFRAREAIFTKRLLEDGAFMVWEVLPEKKDDDVANRTKLVNTSDPELNLRTYLKEKDFEEQKIQELILKARPIISEAENNIAIATNTGIFKPVEIAVKNYRNYEVETFNFNDISFCTINGLNGAGKSSLFMDAIIDCLYEEPREGEKIGWIRNDEKARSGSIMFTFQMGKKLFRITRTRARSGKGTLNIAQFVDGEWVNCSKEKSNDTQKEIINIIGMDSFTFKSCALIMQDQYGLFLQAKPEERVEVLGNLLGLSMYQIMEKISKDKAKVFGAKTKELEQKIEIHNNTIEDLGKPEEKLASCKEKLVEYENQLKNTTEERDRNKLLLTHQQEAVERRNKLLSSIQTLELKKATAEQNRVAQQAIIDSSSLILNNKTEIEAKVAEYHSLLKKELELAGESALYSSKKREAESLLRQATTEQEIINNFQVKVKQKENDLSWAQPTEQDKAVKEKVAEYEHQKKLLDEAYEQERAYREVEQKLALAKHSLQQISTQYDADIKRMKLSEDGLKKKAELLSNVECVDITNAKCGFLADAISAQQALEEYPKQYAERKKSFEKQIEPLNQQVMELEKQLSDMDFDTGTVADISKKVIELKPYVSRLEAIHQRESKIALLEADIKHLQSNILEAEKRLATVKLKGIEAEKECDQYAKAFEEHGQVLSSITILKPWLEKEKQLPVAEERKNTALNRLLELTEEISSIDLEISEKRSDVAKESLAINGIEDLTAIVNGLETEVNAINSLVKEKQKEVGALEQQLEQIEKLVKEITVLQEKQTKYAKETADYEKLKIAFSRSGVPHQIIRSIIQLLTTTANNILGQMTGGKMGVEFRLEKLQKNGKEKVSLDIFIEEYGKAALPYLSKSGGEKVKSSLSVILALAEIKSSSAGIQLGFLQIDEPPFLDSDGTQAYVDALEAIRQRYPDLKIMAITHDQEFKARFPQSVTVYKDELGSHVRWD